MNVPSGRILGGFCVRNFIQVSAPRSFSKTVNLLAEEGTGPRAVQLQAWLHSGSGVLMSLSHLLSQMALVPGTCPAPDGPLSASGPLACNPSGEEMHPPLYSLLKHWRAPHCLQLARPGLPVLVEGSQSQCLVYHSDQEGQTWLPKEGWGAHTRRRQMDTGQALALQD